MWMIIVLNDFKYWPIAMALEVWKVHILQNSLVWLCTFCWNRPGGGGGGGGRTSSEYYVTASLFPNQLIKCTSKTALILSSSLSIFNPGSTSIFHDVCPTWRAVLASNPGSPLNRGEPARVEHKQPWFHGAFSRAAPGRPAARPTKWSRAVYSVRHLETSLKKKHWSASYRGYEVVFMDGKFYESFRFLVQISYFAWNGCWNIVVSWLANYVWAKPSLK